MAKDSQDGKTDVLLLQGIEEDARSCRRTFYSKSGWFDHMWGGEKTGDVEEAREGKPCLECLAAGAWLLLGRTKRLQGYC